VAPRRQADQSQCRGKHDLHDHADEEQGRSDPGRPDVHASQALAPELLSPEKARRNNQLNDMRVESTGSKTGAVSLQTILAPLFCQPHQQVAILAVPSRSAHRKGPARPATNPAQQYIAEAHAIQWHDSAFGLMGKVVKASLANPVGSIHGQPRSTGDNTPSAAYFSAASSSRCNQVSGARSSSSTNASHAPSASSTVRLRVLAIFRSG